MLVSYPALFYKDRSGGYFITFPDFENSATQGEDISDAIYMASDYLEIVCKDMIEYGIVLPIPSKLEELSLVNNDPFIDDEEIKSNHVYANSFVSLITVDLDI